MASEIHQEQVELGLRLAGAAKMAALMGSGQETLIQALLRQGLVSPLRDRSEDLALAAAVGEERLVEDQAMDLLGWLLQTEGDHPVAIGPERGVQLLFQSVNAGHGWVRFFRVEGEAYQRKVEAVLPGLVDLAAKEVRPVVQGLLGLPIGVPLAPEAVQEILGRTRWATGHWMAAVYVPHRGGFAPLGLGYQVMAPLSQGESLLHEGSPAADALLENCDQDLLPARGSAAGLGALWGGEAFVEGLSLGLQGSFRVDIQWEPVSYDNLRGGGPFLGVDIPGVEQGLLGVLLPAPTNRILVTFEAHEDSSLVAIGPLDPDARTFLLLNPGVEEDGKGRLVLPRSQVWRLVSRGLPVWNRLLRAM